MTIVRRFGAAERIVRTVGPNGRGAAARRPESISRGQTSLIDERFVGPGH